MNTITRYAITIDDDSINDSMICVGNMYEANFSKVKNSAVYAGIAPMANANNIFFCILVAESNNVLKSI